MLKKWVCRCGRYTHLDVVPGVERQAIPPGVRRLALRTARGPGPRGVEVEQNSRRRSLHVILLGMPSTTLQRSLRVGVWNSLPAASPDVPDLDQLIVLQPLGSHNAL